MTKSMSIIKRASMQEAVDYEIERAETNSKWSFPMHNQLETRRLNISHFPKTGNLDGLS